MEWLRYKGLCCKFFAGLFFQGQDERRIYQEIHARGDSKAMSTAVAGKGLEGIVAANSGICWIDGEAGVLAYRGIDIHELAEHSTFEETTGHSADESVSDDLGGFMKCRNRALP